MGEGAYGNPFDTGRGDGADGLEGHAAAGFEGDGLVAADCGGFAQLVGGHVVKEDDVHPAQAAEHADLVERVGLDLYGDTRLEAQGFVDSALDAVRVAGDGEVVVLGEHLVEEAEAVVGGAACAHGEALELAEPGRGLARVEDRGAGAFDGIDEPARERGDAGQALEEVEGGALGGEQRSRGASRCERGVAGGEFVAVIFERGDFDVGGNLAEDFGGDIRAS